MQNLMDLFSIVFDLVNREFTIFEFTFSYWQVIVLTCVASVIGLVISKIFER